jgi:predicted enzyme related to lactoylglutathione lyase
MKPAPKQSAQPPLKLAVGPLFISRQSPEKRSSFMEHRMDKTKPWPKNIFAVTIFFDDLQIAKEFYLRVFNLPVDFEDNNSVIFKFGDTLINLLKTSAAQGLIQPAKVANPEAGSRFVFTIRVNDVDAMCAELTARGVTLLNGPIDRPWGVRTASFVDPGGHIWEIAK